MFSEFSKLSLADNIVDSNTAVVVFNNRGSERVIQLRKSVDTKQKRITAGAAHEIFTDCVDDIEGAINFVRAAGVKNVYLAGHSTGCQKSIYWASKKGRGVNGIILLAPVSDYAAALAHYGKAKLERVAKYARSLVAKGKPRELIPLSFWSEELDDAQRFLSLYTPESTEEIFSYVQPKKDPRTLKKVTLPILALWAENDQFGDRPAAKVALWFKEYLNPKSNFRIIPKVDHGFRGGEKQVASAIRAFMKEY